MSHLLRVILAVVFSVWASILYAVDCPDMKKVKAIAKELNTVLNRDFCVRVVNNKQLDWIRNTALPQLMTKSFLGAEPPPGWSDMADEIIKCYSHGNLCDRKVQEDFSQCAMSKMPVIIFQLSPWISQNCVQVNKSVVEHWANKKPVVMKLLKEYLQQF
jgi:hypothetical protein